MNKPRVGLALCGSYCTYGRLFEIIPSLTEKYELVPVMSDTAAQTDSRFGTASEFKGRLTALTGNTVIESIVGAEPLGPAMPLDALIIAPCTGNTLAKLAQGITDSAVTMAAKAHLRNGKPLIIAFSTNDGLSASAKNIGELLNRKNYYFVPFGQDDCGKKPRSLAADFALLPDTVEAALEGWQLQPILL